MKKPSARKSRKPVESKIASAGRTVMIINGGSDGGLLLTTQGASPILAFEPKVLDWLKATSKIISASRLSKDKREINKFTKMAVGAANLAVEMVEDILGPLDPDRAIVYQDYDGGFTCGSTGKPPLPIHWPPTPFKDVNDLVNARVIASDVLNLIKSAKHEGMDLSKLFENPMAAAMKLDVELSAKSAKELSLLAPDNLSNVKDLVDREVIQLFQAVLKDGRFTETWYQNPYEVSKALKMDLSDVAIAQILNVGGILDSGNVADGAIAAGIIWAGVCIAVGTLFVGQMNPIDTLVEDHSEKPKF